MGSQSILDNSAFFTGTRVIRPANAISANQVLYKLAENEYKIYYIFNYKCQSKTIFALKTINDHYLFTDYWIKQNVYALNDLRSILLIYNWEN